MLIAAVLVLGMNHGLGRLARSTPFSYRQLAWAADWHIREETLRAALVELDQFVLRHPLAATGASLVALNKRISPGLCAVQEHESPVRASAALSLHAATAFLPTPQLRRGAQKRQRRVHDTPIHLGVKAVSYGLVFAPQSRCVTASQKAEFLPVRIE